MKKSISIAVLGAALVGCVPAPRPHCINGVLYIAQVSSRGGITPAIDLNGKPVPCKSNEKAAQ